MFVKLGLSNQLWLLNFKTNYLGANPVIFGETLENGSTYFPDYLVLQTLLRTVYKI